MRAYCPECAQVVDVVERVPARGPATPSIKLYARHETLVLVRKGGKRKRYRRCMKSTSLVPGHHLRG